MSKFFFNRYFPVFSVLRILLVIWTPQNKQGIRFRLETQLPVFKTAIRLDEFWKISQPWTSMIIGLISFFIRVFYGLFWDRNWNCRFSKEPDRNRNREESLKGSNGSSVRHERERASPSVRERRLIDLNNNFTAGVASESETRHSSRTNFRTRKHKGTSVSNRFRTWIFSGFRGEACFFYWFYRRKTRMEFVGLLFFFFLEIYAPTECQT